MLIVATPCFWALTMRALFVPLVFLVLAFQAAASGTGSCPSSGLSVRNAYPAGSSFASTDTSCATQHNLLTPGLGDVEIIWFHDVPGITGLGVAVDGPGLHANVTLNESTYNDPVAPATAYESGAIALPPGFSGRLIATLFQNGTEIESNFATTLT